MNQNEQKEHARKMALDNGYGHGHDRDDSMRSRFSDLKSALASDFGIGDQKKGEEAHRRIAEREGESLDRFYGKKRD